MTNKIRIGIVGYGNLGRGVHTAIQQNPDMSLECVFSRRDPSTVEVVEPKVPVHSLDKVDNFKGDIDVLILCGGSKNDLPEQGPALAELFCTVDSFDTHARIPEYFEQVNTAAIKGGTTSLISTGWDPGLFSINRLYGESILPLGATYTFWGKGLSQGHSDAVRRVPGVKAAVQYTIPSENAMQRVRNGENPNLTTRERHTRECFVVLDDGANEEEVRAAIVNMPDYFADYDTTVNFISMQTLEQEHSSMPHGGVVIRSGTSGNNSNQVIEYSLALESNPEFTSSVLVAYARAIYKLHKQGSKGAFTVFDIAPGLLSPKSPAQLRKELL